MTGTFGRLTDAEFFALEEPPPDDRRTRIVAWIAAWDRAAETRRLEFVVAQNYSRRKGRGIAAVLRDEVLGRREASCRARGAFWSGFVSALDALDVERARAAPDPSGRCPGPPRRHLRVWGRNRCEDCFPGEDVKT